MKQYNLKQAFDSVPSVYHTKIVDALEQLEDTHMEQIKKRRISRRGLIILIAAATTILCTVAFTVIRGYFNVRYQSEENRISYRFDINYELIPGKFNLTANYVPEGYNIYGDFTANSGKILIVDNTEKGISIWECLTTAELDAMNAEIALENVVSVEELQLSGMQTEIITFDEAEKYRKDNVIFMFNPDEGYVIRVNSNYSVPREELIKVLDNLTIERVDDGDLVKKGSMQVEMQNIPPSVYVQERMVPTRYYELGDTLAFNGYEFTVNSVEYMDCVAGYDPADFYNYDMLAERLEEDGTLRNFTRETYQWNISDAEEIEFVLSKEEDMQQVFVKVNITAKAGEEFLTYADRTCLQADIEFATTNDEGKEIWVKDYYNAIPSEYESYRGLHCQEGAIYMDCQEDLSGDERLHQFFWKEFTAGEEINYNLIFIMDRDELEKTAYMKLWMYPSTYIRLN